MFTTTDPIQPAPAPGTSTAPTYQWYLDVGAYFDRFGALKLPILSSTDPILKAAVMDTQSRHWVDLQNPEVAQILSYMLGNNVLGLGTINAPIPGLTAAINNSVLTTLPSPQEQLALIKLFFS